MDCSLGVNVNILYTPVHKLVESQLMTERLPAERHVDWEEIGYLGKEKSLVPVCMTVMCAYTLVLNMHLYSPVHLVWLCH
jgi:hypothetical protein